MSSEVWNWVERYEGLYEVSSHGRIRSHWRGGRVMKASSNGRGYLQVNLTSRTGKKERRYLHRMILETFVGVEPMLDANHLDGVKSNNRLDNLEWCTRSENHLHRYSVLNQESPMKGLTGRAHPKSKKYRITDPSGDVFIVHGLRSFCKDIGVDLSGMFIVMNGKAPTHRGYHCERVN